MPSEEIVLPWPDRKLHPNSRVHWAPLAKAKKAAKRDAFLVAKSVGWDKVEWPDGRLHVWIDGYAKDRRRRDHDGFLASLKAQLDGIAMAMGVDDSRFVPHPYIKGETRNPAEVRIRITVGADAD
ncbi:MAG: hypothetical protein ACPH5V_03015 [Alcanivorax sp.]